MNRRKREKARAIEFAKRKARKEQRADYEVVMAKLKIVIIVLSAIIVIFAVLFPNGVPWAQATSQESSMSTVTSSAVSS